MKLALYDSDYSYFCTHNRQDTTSLDRMYCSQNIHVLSQSLDYRMFYASIMSKPLSLLCLSLTCTACTSYLAEILAGHNCIERTVNKMTVGPIWYLRKVSTLAGHSSLSKSITHAQMLEIMLFEWVRCIMHTCWFGCACSC